MDPFQIYSIVAILLVIIAEDIHEKMNTLNYSYFIHHEGTPNCFSEIIIQSTNNTTNAITPVSPGPTD